MRILLVGYGRMGRAAEALAIERGHVIHSVVRGEGNRNGEALTPERISGADLALEFTRPASAVGNLERLMAAGIPTVTGTTGWLEQLPQVEKLVAERRGALLYSANFSVGVQLFLRVGRDLARRLAGRTEFLASILEEHHAAKVDAPSGTALRLRDALSEADPARDFPITSVRAGFVPGIHVVRYDAPQETIRLEHSSRSRQAFAAGALAAAEWLPGRAGVFSFEEMLFGREP